jgi:hypothetical protein
MEKLARLTYRVIAVATVALYPSAAGTQTNSAVSSSIAARPLHWCLPEAGDDPAHIISGRCKVYRECLSDLGLSESVDNPPFSSLIAPRIDSVRKCHQGLFNGARSNPQLKGSDATQQWLQHAVHPGTEAKSFPAPQSFPDPR